MTLIGFVLLALLVAVLFQQARRSTVPGSIALPAEKFWSIVQSQERPIVLLTTRGTFGLQRCYAFPYNGVIFRTDAKHPAVPAGVTLVHTGNTFGL